MSGPNASDEAAATEADWDDWVAWSFPLLVALHDVRDRKGRQQRFIDALVARYECHGKLMLMSSMTGESAKESQTMTARVKGLRHVIGPPDDKLPRIESTLSLPTGFAARLVLWRPRNGLLFTDLDARRLALLHNGCAWVYEPVSTDADQRLDLLSPREREALQHFMQGKSEKEVAIALGRSRHTVHAYVKRIYRTLGVHSRAQLRSMWSEGRDPEADSSSVAPREFI